MKIMSRNFTRVEKILLLVLALILVGLIYYRFVDRNIRETIVSANAEASELQTELDIMEQKITVLQAEQSEMDSIESSGKMTRMGSYNNSKEEIAFLNDVLADTLQYSVSFSDVTRSGDQIRRNFALQYRTASYDAAQVIMRELCEGEFRCLVGDVSCSIADDGTVTISQSATFYETMVGGTADSGLPADTAAVNEVTEEGAAE